MGLPPRETMTDKELIEKLKDLLRIADCPNPCKSGAIQTAEDEYEQCEFCAERKQLLK